jgi:hypothetical protein
LGPRRHECTEMPDRRSASDDTTELPDRAQRDRADRASTASEQHDTWRRLTPPESRCQTARHEGGAQSPEHEGPKKGTARRQRTRTQRPARDRRTR